MARQREKRLGKPVPDDTYQRIRSGVTHDTPTRSPFGPEHLRALNELIQACTETDDVCCKCKDAGIDVDQEMKVNADQKKMAETLKRHFFPHVT